MRTSNGFDRLSTQEELHQVLAVLNARSRNGWVVADEGSPCDDIVLEEEDSAEAEAIAELAAKTPELKN